MTRIRATCPRCGEVDLQPDDVELRVRRSAAGEVADGSRYRFACPGCAEEIVKPADERVARLLATGGVAVVIERPDALLVGHPAPPGEDGPPPLTYDDLLAFHELLEQDDWFHQLEAGLR